MNRARVISALQREDISIIPDVVHTIGIDATGYGEDGSSTLLHESVKFGQLDFTNRLLGVDANARIANSNGELPFHVAAIFGHVEIGQLLIKMRGLGQIDSRCANGTNKTAIHLASYNGHVEFVRMLIEEQEATVVFAAILNGKTGITPLHAAIYGNKENCVSYLAKWNKGKLLHIPDGDGNIPLRLALKLDYIEQFRILIKNGANIEERDSKTGRNVFEEAIVLNKPDVIKVLVKEFKVNLNSRSLNGNDGSSILHLAISLDHIAVLKMLVGLGAKVDKLRDSEGNSALHLAARLKHFDAIKVLCGQGKADVDVKNNLGRTPLALVAAEHGDREVAEILFDDFDADLEATSGENDYAGATPFQLACIKGNLKFAKFALDDDALKHDNIDGENALHLCAANGIEKSVTFLLENGSNVNSTCSKGRTALHEAAIGDHLGTVKILLANGAKREVVSLCPEDNRFTAKMLAASHGAVNVFRHLFDGTGKVALEQIIKLASHGEIVELFVENLKKTGGEAELIAAVNEGGFLGRTHLHTACLDGKVEVARVLIKYAGADVNIQSGSKDFLRTPLHFAVILGKEEIIDLLVEFGADLYTRDAFNNTPLHLAALAGHYRIVEKFVQRGADVGKRGFEGRTALHLACTWIGESDNDLPPALRNSSNSSKPQKQKEKVDLVKLMPELSIEQILVKKIRIVLKVPGYQDDEIVSQVVLPEGAYKQKLAIVKLLINEMPALASVFDKRNDRAVHLAAKTGHFDIVQFFIDWRSDVFLESIGYRGRTLLQSVVLEGQFSIAVFLLESKACLSAKDKETGSTALHLLARKGIKFADTGNKNRKFLVIFELLLNFGAPLDATDKNGDLPLHVAIETACENHDPVWYDVVSLIVEAGADLDAVDKNGYTALERAAASKGDNEDIADILLQSECKVHLIRDNSDGPTYGQPIPRALEIANKHGNIKIAILLKKVPIFRRPANSRFS